MIKNIFRTLVAPQDHDPSAINAAIGDIDGQVIEGWLTCQLLQLDTNGNILDDLTRNISVPITEEQASNYAGTVAFIQYLLNSDQAKATVV